MNIYWKGTVPSGSFTSAGNWVQSSVPGISDIAELTTGATVTVSTAMPVTVLGVNLALGTLLINTDFAATEGTAIGSNHGTVEVNNGARFSAGGTVKNFSVINVNSGTLAVDDLDLIVKGGGLIGMGGSDATLVVSAGQTLVNVDNTIAGQGTITDAGTLVNQSSGVIEATHSSGTLFLDIATRNQGTIEAIDLLGASRLQINGSVINNTAGGVIRAVGSSTVGIGTDSTIIGGTVTAQSGGTSVITGTNVTFDGGKSVVPTNTMITLNGEVDVDADAVLNLKGTINNSGSIDAGSATLVVQPGATNSTVTLKGSGQIDLSGSGETARITGGGSAVTFDNVNNKINGGGTIGGAGLKVKNEVGGVFDANDGTLIIDTGANTIINAGLMNAGGGALVIASNLSNTGKLIADDGMVYAVGTVIGGTAIISGGSSAVMEFGDASNTATKFAMGTTGQLILADSAQYTGVISGFGATQSIDLADFDFTGAHKVSFSLGVLTLKNTAGQVVRLHFSGTHTLASFSLSDDLNFNGTDDGTKIADPPAPAKPQSPLSNPLANLFSQFMASWSPSTALSSEVHSPLANELQMATNLLHAHG